MDGVLSQEEITALLQNGGDVPGAGTAASGGEQISADECDTIGEIANIVADGENHLVGYQFLLH